jgi:biopolymer transport protein ExbD
MAIRTSRDDDDALDENHAINVTPLIDVMLVLLIVFMVAAPLATVSVPVELPASSATPQPREHDPVYLTLHKDLSLSLDDTRIERDALKPALDRLTRSDRDQRIFLRADRAVAYGELMQTMNLLREAGYLKVALVGLERTEQ